MGRICIENTPRVTNSREHGFRSTKIRKNKSWFVRAVHREMIANTRTFTTGSLQLMICTLSMCRPDC